MSMTKESLICFTREINSETNTFVETIGIDDEGGFAAVFLYPGSDNDMAGSGLKICVNNYYYT